LRKELSALLYLAYPINPTDRIENTDILLSLFSSQNGERLRHLSIYGEFYPLDFNRFTIQDGYLNCFSNLSKSNVPNGKVVFIDTEFVDIDTAPFGKNHLDPVNFSNCILPSGMQEYMDVGSVSNTNQIESVLSDLRKILRVGFRGNAFVWKSEAKYRQKCGSLNKNIKLTNYLGKLVEGDYLIKEQEISGSGHGYRVSPKYKVSIIGFITQGLIGPEIEAMVEMFIDVK